MGRLTIDISDHQHQRLKALAALQGKTIREFAIERLFPATAGDDQAWDELQTMIGQRIERGLAGEPLVKSVAAIVDEELGQERRA